MAATLALRIIVAPLHVLYAVVDLTCLSEFKAKATYSTCQVKPLPFRVENTQNTLYLVLGIMSTTVAEKIVRNIGTGVDSMRTYL